VLGRYDRTWPNAATADGRRGSRRWRLRLSSFRRDATIERGRRSEEMRTREGRRRGEDLAVLAHRFDNRDARMAAASTDSGE
jgi:hypothetical protein